MTFLFIKIKKSIKHFFFDKNSKKVKTLEAQKTARLKNFMKVHLDLP